MAENTQESKLNRFWERLGIPVCTLQEARKVIELGFDNKQVVCLIGEAGIGKTQLLDQIAQDRAWDRVTLYLAHLEREDIGGIPFPTGNGSMTYEFLCEKAVKQVIDSKKPTLLVLDEWNRGEKATMNAAFTLMEARRFGSYELPDHVFLGAAMNPSESNYIVNEAEKDPAFRRRLVMLAVQSNIASFMNYARNRGEFHETVLDFLEAQPIMLNDITARDAGKVYANPAAWEKISDGLKAIDAKKQNPLSIERTLLLWGGGIVGMQTMSTLLDFIKERAAFINPDEIITNYKRKAQRKILRLVKSGRNDALLEMCESVAVALVGRLDTPEIKDHLGKVARNLGSFLCDLPREATMGFLTKLGKHATDFGQEGTQFHLNLSEELSKVEDYQKAIERIGDAHDIVERDVENGKSV